MTLVPRVSPLLLLVLACSPKAREPEAPPPAPVQAAAPAPAQTPPPAAPAAPPQEAPATAPFHPVVSWKDFGDSGDPVYRVFATRDGDVFLSAGPQIMKAARDGSVERNPSWLGGIRDPDNANPEGNPYLAAWYVQTLGGRWPDALFMTVYVYSGGRMEEPIEVYRFANGGWTFLPERHPVLRSHPRVLAQWRDDSVLSLRGFTSVAEPEDETGLSKADERAFKAALARTNPLAVVRGAPKAPKLGSDLVSFDALPSGELVAVAANASRVVHLAADGTSSTTTLPDAASLSAAKVVMTAADDVYVIGALPHQEEDDAQRPYLAHFDGKTWTKEVVPACTGAAAALSPFSNGEAWLLCSPEDVWFGGGYEGLQGSGTVWHREGGAWSQVPLPDHARGIQLVATAPDEVWVAADRGIYYSKKPPQQVELPSLTELTLQLREHSPVVPLLSCAWGTTLLKTDPAGDHPEFVSALETIEKAFEEEPENLELVEVDFRGKPHLALQTGFDGISAEVVRAVERALGDELGETRCVHREPRRVLWSSAP